MSKSKSKNRATHTTIASFVDTVLAAPAGTLAPTQDASAAVPTATVETKATSKKSRRAVGLGCPNARKLVNPQHTLEIKKAAARKAGAEMVWAKKFWVVTMPGRDALTFASREMAALSEAAFLARISPLALPAPQA